MNLPPTSLEGDMDRGASRQPLEGIVVLDVSQIYNGPYATFLLAAAGAIVIKVEPPGGEPLRRRAEAGGGAALPFAMLNSWKRSVVLDLKTGKDKAAFLRLASGADVLVENFAPGTMARLGLDAETVQARNARLIYASSSGFGSDGPYRDYLAMDLTVQAMAGVMTTTGYEDGPPVKAGPAMCDFLAGIHLYGAIVTALYERERTGVARRIEVAMQDAVYPTLSSSLGMHWNSRHSAHPLPVRTGNRHGGLAEAPYNVYPASDGWVAIICVGETHWASFARAMNRPELAHDQRFATLRRRVAAIDEVDAVVSEWTRSRTKQEIFKTLMAHRVPCAPVRDLDEIMNDPNMHARGALQWIDHPALGRIVVQHSPLRFQGVAPLPLEPSHELGADTAELLRDFANVEQV